MNDPVIFFTAGFLSGGSLVGAMCYFAYKAFQKKMSSYEDLSDDELELDEVDISK